QQEIQSTGEPIKAALVACAELAREHQRRAAAHSLEFGCPNGLALLSTEADLLDLHGRCFPQSDEQQVAAEFYTRIAAQPDPCAMLADADRLYRFLRDTAPDTLIGARLAERNVMDELIYHFPQEVHLGSVVRERDMEAYERLPLISTSDQTSGQTLVRLFGV